MSFGIILEFFSTRLHDPFKEFTCISFLPLPHVDLDTTLLSLKVPPIFLSAFFYKGRVIGKWKVFSNSKGEMTTWGLPWSSFLQAVLGNGAYMTLPFKKALLSTKIGKLQERFLVKMT